MERIISGHYMYIETSAPRRLGHKARLLSPLVHLPGTNCIKFFYYMYGASVDTLSVYVKEDHSNLSFPVWRRTGTQGTNWTEGRFPVTNSQRFQVCLSGTDTLLMGTTVKVSFVSLLNTGLLQKKRICSFWEQILFIESRSV